MKSIGELLGKGSGKHLAILGGRSGRENHEWWLDRCRRDANQGGLNHVAPVAAAEPPPDPGEAPELLRLHLERSGVPERVADILRGNLDVTPPVRAVRNWWGTGASFLLLHGDTGRGKSVAAASALLEMRRVVRWNGGERSRWDSSECSFESADELARMSYFGEEQHQTMKHLGKVTCLVLDDLGAELMTEGWRATLDALLAERFGRTRCRTVLTTNVSTRRPKDGVPSPFEERYGTRIARRIRESGAVIAVGAE